MKKFFWIFAFISVFVLGIWFAQNLRLPLFENVQQEDSQVLLDRIEEVTKLITVQGYFSEIYDYKDYYGYDWSIFRKKALIRVKAKVSMGFDLESLDLEVIPDRKVIRLSALPEVKLISIDHDLDYYDISEGTFNSFNNEDLNDLNKKAKSYIEQVALQSDLPARAAKKGSEMVETLSFLVKGAGWTLEVKEIDSRSVLRN
jgi:hypothetical protein